MRWSSFIISMKISKISIFVNASLSMCLWLTHLILLFMSSFSFKTFKIHRQLPKCHKISSTFSRQILISSLVFILKGAEASAIDFLHMKLRPANCLSRGAYFSKKNLHFNGGLSWETQLCCSVTKVHYLHKVQSHGKKGVNSLFLIQNNNKSVTIWVFSFMFFFFRNND